MFVLLCCGSVRSDFITIDITKKLSNISIVKHILYFLYKMHILAYFIVITWLNDYKTLLISNLFCMSHQTFIKYTLGIFLNLPFELLVRI